MQYIFTNSEIDRKISQIKKKIYLLMNGELSSSMKKSGLIYPKNYGVNIIKIREIAQDIEKDHDLAQRLWQLDIRETMILASLLQPVDTFTQEIAAKWLERVHNIELAEQLSINLLRHLDYAPELSISYIQSSNIQTKILGFTLASWLYESFTDEAIQAIIDEVLELDYQQENTLLYNKIALCLAKLCRKNKETAHLIFNSTADFGKDDKHPQKHIYLTIKQELIFLEYLNDDV